MTKHLKTSLLYTVITAVLLGIVYPLAITGLSRVLFPKQAEGSLIRKNGRIIGSSLLGQSFTGAGYFHSRPSAAGAGYDASASSGSNLAPTSQTLVTRIANSTTSEAAGADVPVDLVTASASGLDPDITPAAALYQVSRVAKERNLPTQAVRDLVLSHVTPRQFGLLGEPRVNVLQLNLALDSFPLAARSH